LVFLLGPGEKIRLWGKDGFSVDPDRIATTYAGGKVHSGVHDYTGPVLPAEPFAADDDIISECTIQLDDCNTVKGRLKCGLGLDVVIDSGSTITLLTSEVVNASPYLSALPRIRTEPVRIRVADGSIIVSDTRIQFVVTIDSYDFYMDAHIMPSFGLVKALLGTDDLKRLGAKLDFTSNQLTVKLNIPRTTPFRVKENVWLKPHESRMVALWGRLPKNLSTGDIILNASQKGQSLTSSCLLTKVKKGTCLIPVYNNSDKISKLHKGRILAYADFNATHSGRYHIHEAVFDNFHVKPEIDRSRLIQKNLKKFPFLDASDVKTGMTESEILEDEVDLDTDCSLTTPERNRLKYLLIKHKKAFSFYGEVGDTKHVVRLHLVDETPFFIRPYTVSEEEKLLIDKELDKLVNMGVLERGVASCSSPVMLVAKKGTKAKRVVADLRVLNTKIRRQNWPFPLVRDTIQKLGMSDCAVVSTIDLKEAFHSLHLDKESQQYTGITSYFGGRSYYYKRMPMGASISPSEWQSFVEKVLDDVPGSRDFCVAHMDDLIIFSKTVDEHFRHIDTLLQGLTKHGLKLSPKKAKFCKSRVVYMGHVISIVDGRPCITAMRSKCEAIKGLRIPENSKDVRRFIGAVTYLADYIPNLQFLLRHLHKISSKKSTFIWSPECQSDYDMIKSLLCSPPVLHMPSKHGDFVLYSDTSRVATGGTLCQIIGNEERVIGYHSKILPEAALRYSVSELEYKGLCINIHAFRNILRSVPFRAVVDHSALVQIQTSKKEPPTERFKKLLESLSDYSFTLSYIPGKRLAMSDMLSRMCTPDLTDSHEVVPIACLGDKIEDALVLTRSQAKQQGVVLGNPRDYGVQPATRGSAQSRVSTQPEVPPSGDIEPGPSIEVSGDLPQDINIEPLLHDFTPTQPVTETPSPVFIPGIPVVEDFIPNVPVAEDSAPIPTPVIPVPISGETHSLVENQYKVTGGQSKTEIPLESLIPRNTRASTDFDAVPHHSPCPEPLTQPNAPLFTHLKTDWIKLDHLPKYVEVKKHLLLIKQKCLRDFNIPLKSAEIKREYRTSLYFSEIYKYLKSGELPARQRRARSVMKNCENYVLIQDLLFRISLADFEDDICLQLCIPESQATFVISMYHDSLMAMHQGVTRTFNTIKAKFFIPGLYDRLCTFLRSCTVCQERKVPQSRDSHQVRENRIFTEYKPFSEIHLDIKHMFPASDGSNYLVIATCVQTRYVVGIPVKNIEATTIAEVLLQRLVFQFGIPRFLVTDLGSQFTAKVFNLVCQTLGTEQIYVSPENHGSLVCERSIQTISKLLLSQLQGNGRAWCFYVQAACHAYNTFAHTTLGGFSPFELVYMRKPPDWLGIETHPLDGVPVTYLDYVDQLRQRLKLIGSLVLKLHNEAQEREALKHADSLRKTPCYMKGQLVYFLMPSSGALKTNTRKFIVSYVGPVRIKSVLDTTHVVLEDLSGRTISGIHHTNRIKPAYIRGRFGVISNTDELTKQVNAQFSFDETRFPLSNHTLGWNEDGVFYTENKESQRLAFPQAGDILECSKQRYQNGALQVLFTTRVKGVVPPSPRMTEFSEWYDVGLFPSLHQDLMFHAYDRCTGSKSGFQRKLN